jgi:hypothetical protein
MQRTINVMEKTFLDENSHHRKKYQGTNPCNISLGTLQKNEKRERRNRIILLIIYNIYIVDLYVLAFVVSS